METSGLQRNSRIYSLGGIVFETKEEFGPVVKGSTKIFHEFFRTDYPVSPEVQHITGLNRQVINDNAQNLYFEEKLDDFMPFFKGDDITYVGYNIKSFDNLVLNNSLRSCGEEEIDFSHCRDMMQESRGVLKYTVFEPFARKNIKQYQAVNFLIKEGNRINPCFKKLTDKDLENLFFGFCDANGFKGNALAQLHSALYDSFLCYMLIVRINHIKREKLLLQ